MDRQYSFGEEGHPMAKFIRQVTLAMDDEAPTAAARTVLSKRATHAFMNGANKSKKQDGYNHGWIVLPRAQEDEFLQLMAQAIDGGFQTCVSEMVQPDEPRRAFADFDVKTVRPKDRMWYLEVATIWIESLRECWPELPDFAFLTCVLLRKPSETTAISGDRVVKRIKGGMHLVVPNLVVSEEQLQIVREVALQKLQDHKTLLQSGDGTWEKTLDEDADRLRMLGNAKKETCKACRCVKGKREACVECAGRGQFIDTEAAYDIAHILNADGTTADATETNLRNGSTFQKLKLTCIRANMGSQVQAGFVRPAHVTLPAPRAKKKKGGKALDGTRGGDGKAARGDKDGKPQELMEESDPNFEVLQAHARMLHPDYRDIRLREISVHRTAANKRDKYILRPWNGTTYRCLNLASGTPHGQQSIHFVVTRDKGIVKQGCGCKCDKGVEQGRLRGKCSKVLSTGQHNIILPIVTRLELFDYGDVDRQRLMEEAECDRMAYKEDGWRVRGMQMLTAACLRRMNTKPSIHVSSSDQRLDALAAYMRASGSSKRFTIKQRKQEQRRAEKEAEKIRGHILALVGQMATMQNTDHAGMLQESFRDSLVQEHKRLEERKAIMKGTHCFSRRGVDGVGVFSNGDFLHVDGKTGDMTYYPPRQTVETVVRGAEVTQEEEAAWTRLLMQAEELPAAAGSL